MAKKPSINNITTGYTSAEAINENFQNVRDAFDNTLSLDGSTPNAMNADLNMNGNSILNAGGLTVSGVDYLAQALAYRNAAQAAQTGAEAAEAAALVSETNAAASAAIVTANKTNIDIVAGNVADLNTVAGISSNVTTVAGISSDIAAVGAISSDVTAVAADAIDIGTVSSNITNVNTVAGISADVSTVAADGTDIGLVAGISSDVTTVSGISGNVTSVALISSDIAAVAADAVDIGIVSANVSNVNTVAGISGNVTTVAGISADVTAVAGDATDIGTVATSIADVNTVASIAPNVTTVAGINSNVTTVAGISSSVTAVAADATDIGTVASNINGTNTIGTVAGSISNVNAVGGSISSVNTVANNINNVNDFFDVYRTGTSFPTTNLNIGDLFLNTTTGVLYVYTTSGWTTGVTAGSGFMPISGGTFTGGVVLSGDPTNSLDAATKQYVDTIAAAGMHYHAPVRVESPSPLTASYDNGTAGVGATLTNSGTQAALVIEGITLSLNDRVLVYTQTNAFENGIYYVSDTGSASTNWVLTRTTDTDSYGASDPNALGQGDAFFVLEGNTGAGELYVMNTQGEITFGTTGITFTQVAATAVYSAGTGLTLTGTEFAAAQDIATSAIPTFAGLTVNGSISVTGTVDGRNVATDGTKLDGIESGATGDQTASEILASISTVDGVGSGLDADLLDGQHGSYFLNTATSFGGDVSGTYDAIVIADDSHNHIIDNIDGLQAALDGKQASGSYLTDGGSHGTVTLSNWIRTTGDTGWYNATYDGGMYMTDSTWVRSYNNKGLHAGNRAGTTYASDDNSSLQVQNNGGTGDGNAAAISYHCSGYYGVKQHLRPDGYFGVGGWSASPWRWYVYLPNGDMTAAGNVTAYSDARLKEDIVPLENSLDKIKSLNGVRFKWKDLPDVVGAPNKVDFGVLAHEVEAVAPEVISSSPHISPDGDPYKTVAYDKLVPLLIEAIKEQQTQIDDLKARLEALE